ncbi:MAG: FAD-binding protein [Chitinivibrionales bacterium]
MSIRVDIEKCVGCGLCIKACPVDAIKLKDKKAVIDLDKCTLCGSCVEACEKFGAITIERKEKVREIDKSQYRNVGVFIEQKEDSIEDVSYEMMGEGRKLADKIGEDLIVFLIGYEMHKSASKLVKYGADKVIYYNGKDLEHFKDDTYTALGEKFINDEKPAILLAGATSIGRSFIPKLAARVFGGLTADCTKLEVNEETKLLHGTRPAFGGNLMATILCPERRPQMATVRHKVMKKAGYDEKREGEVITHDFEDGSIRERTKIIDMVKEVESTVNIAEADVIVSGGRGMQNPDNLKYIRELAELLGGAVGASRAIVDAGWIPYSHQVGQTGKTVCPKVYIACGISGAVQHQAGMQSADYIIAINKDPEADIFDIADTGIVGDVLEILPKLIQELKG